MTIRKRRVMLLLWLALLGPTTGHGQSLAAGRLGGHLKSLDLYLEAPPAGQAEAGVLSSNSLRFDLSLPVAEVATFEFAVEGRTLYADPASGIALASASPNRRLDLEKSWRENDWFSQRAGIDRLNLTGTNRELDWSIGRQAVGFGRIGLFSPLDVIAPFPPDALDSEIRPGVDALRAGRYFGTTGQVGAVAVFGREWEDDSYLMYGETNRSGVDLLGMAGQLRERPMLGGGFATQLGGMGFKAEATGYRGHRINRPAGDLRETFVMAATEVDYRFAGGPVLFVQYLFNGVGVNEPREYPDVAASAPLAEGLSYLLGRHYLLASATHELHPLVNLSGLVIWNLGDDSFLLRPLLSLSLADDLTLELFWNINRGARPRVAGFPPIPMSRSEFGSVGDSGGLYLKFFF